MHRWRVPATRTQSIYGFGHPVYYENVIKTLRGEATAETDGREGLRSLELLIAIYTSARTGGEFRCHWNADAAPNGFRRKTLLGT